MGTGGAVQDRGRTRGRGGGGRGEGGRGGGKMHLVFNILALQW